MDKIFKKWHLHLLLFIFCSQQPVFAATQQGNPPSTFKSASEQITSGMYHRTGQIVADLLIIGVFFTAHCLINSIYKNKSSEVKKPSESESSEQKKGSSANATPKKVKNHSLQEISKHLSSSIFGLTKAKEQILSYLAKLERSPQAGGKVLCLNGPPGVGKTSFAKAVADALGRPFVSISCNTLTDPGQLTGQPSVYRNAREGLIAAALKQAKCSNPVILLDEVEKTGASQHGLISDTLLTILDKKQNKNFKDGYLDKTIDLSQVLFICTCNEKKYLTPPLMDRMHIIDLKGYSKEEKVTILSNHTIPSARKECNLTEDEFSVSKECLEQVVARYSPYESGMRKLEQLIEELAGKVVLHLSLNKKEKKFPCFCSIEEVEKMLSFTPLQPTAI